MPNTKRIAALLVGLATLSYGATAAADASIDKSVMSTLKQCKAISTSCASTTKNAVGVLVFPEVVKADFIIGGAGGKGALVENGHITGYYNIGAASAGIQAGIESSSQIYVFRNKEVLNQLKQSGDWKVGAGADVALVEADANARAVMDHKILAYVFDGKGLHAGIALDVFDVWKSGETRPEASSN